MKIIEANKLCNGLKTLLQISIVIGILLLLFIPSLLGLAEIKFNLFYLLIYPAGICFLLIVYQFIGMFSAFINEDYFNNGIVKKIKKASIFSFIISCFMFIDTMLATFLYKETLSFILFVGFITILFFGVAIALYLLEEIFKKSISYKEENELTI